MQYISRKFVIEYFQVNIMTQVFKNKFVSKLQAVYYVLNYLSKTARYYCFYQFISIIQLIKSPIQDVKNNNVNINAVVICLLSQF